MGPPAAPAAVARLAEWQRRYALVMLAVDAVLLVVTTSVAYVTRFGSAPGAGGASYMWMSSVGVALWLGFLAAGGAYDERFLSFGGVEEIKRVFNSSVRFVAAVALVSYGAKIDVSRGFVVIGCVLGTAMLVVGRHVGHIVLRRLRCRGHMQSRLLVVGDTQ